MALTASVRREGAALGAGASGRRKKAGAPRNGEESFLAAAWQGRPWRDKVVVAMAVFMAALEVELAASYLSNPLLAELVLRPVNTPSLREAFSCLEHVLQSWMRDASHLFPLKSQED